MIKIVQFGEGNFLRTFVDLYFDTLNKEGGDYKVNIVKPITFGSLENFDKQNNKYHIVLRGVKNGKDVEDVYKVDVLEGTVSPFEDIDKYYALAVEDDLKIIVSNTTEAGICYHEEDKFDGFENITYPAKLTKFLYTRFKAGKEGLYMMPVELIDNNADELYSCVDKYIKLWNLGADFKKWNDEQNYYCNTLVDRIVSGNPKDEQTKNHLIELIGEDDKLVSVGEPFGLWAVENKGEISKYIKEGVHNIEVVLADSIKYYKKRKVRVLNGSHTNIVPVGLWKGAITVYDCMKDATLSKFLEDTLNEDIVPFVSNDIEATKVFAESIKGRFLNPYLNHQLVSISLNSISKWRARDLPSFKDYYESHGKIAPHLTIGFSYLMAIYKSVVKKDDGKYYVKLPTREIELKDDIPYLEYFANGGCVIDFMKDVNVWGEDLTSYNGFADAVKQNVKTILSGENII
ncbi:MAG: tagaturonate reductase [Clostridia bacterium]|nr:tagaturonate reductase [Clostridia bacterium]